MKVSEFDYELPKSLIADYPTPNRSHSRLMVLQAGARAVQHAQFSDIAQFVEPQDLLVFNDTRVIPARLYGHKESGGKFEALVERLLDGNQLLAQMKLSKAAKPGNWLNFELNSSKAEQDSADPVRAQVLGREGEFYRLQFDLGEKISAILSRIGHIPLPPYIARADELVDEERYQTVYAKNEGAVAAPTAGLHFDLPLLKELAQKGVAQEYITLHVGAGTFQSIRVDSVEDHQMHREWVQVSEHSCEQIRRCKQRGGRVIAVGTTTVRSLETCALNRDFSPFEGETDIFIYPGFEFKVVDAMITNFHLPQSSLLMLVSAFKTQELMLNAYKEAVAQKYRFFSYGDAMFLSR